MRKSRGRRITPSSTRSSCCKARRSSCVDRERRVGHRSPPRRRLRSYTGAKTSARPNSRPGAATHCRSTSTKPAARRGTAHWRRWQRRAAPTASSTTAPAWLANWQRWPVGSRLRWMRGSSRSCRHGCHGFDVRPIAHGNSPSANSAVTSRPRNLSSSSTATYR
jgi:hypothetical protein